MEIKVIQTIKEDVNAGFKTFLFEGTGLVHETIDYRDTQHLREQVKSRTVQGCTMEMGFPAEWWNTEKNDKTPGSFLLIQYVDEMNGEIKFLILKNCEVYITTKSRTVDKVFVN